MSKSDQIRALWEARFAEKPARVPAKKKAASDSGQKINAKPAATGRDGRGRPKGEPTMAILVTVPLAWLAWLDGEQARRQMTSRPMTIRAIVGDAKGAA